MRYPLLTFNAGELSPQIDARSDVEKYGAGCRTMENMIPRIYGTAERRPGTKYIDTCSGTARVIPFIYSETVAYIVLLEDLAMYFYYDGGRVIDGSGRRVKVDTPYSADSLFQIQYKQNNDVLWLTHPDYPPMKLSRTSATSFTLEEITFENGPFQKRNDLANGDGVTLAPSVTTGTGTLTASSSLFTASHVGGLFAITQPRVLTELELDVTILQYTLTPSVGTSTEIPVDGSWTLTTHGFWTGKIILQRRVGLTGNWETYKAWTSEADSNVQYNGEEEEDDVYYRLTIDTLEENPMYIWPTGGGCHIRAVFTVNSSTQTGICRITGYTSGTSVSMEVLSNFASILADERWAEGCWSDERGYPRCMTFFEQRAIYAGSPHQTSTIWLSATDDYEDFEAGVDGDDSFSLTLSSDTAHAIQWICPLEALIIGTSEGEWRLRSSAYDEPLTPTKFSCKQQTTYGSMALQAIPINDAIVFVDKTSKKVREITYSSDRDKFVCRDLTALAEHITSTGIVCWSYQKAPDSILWSTKTNGTLLSMTDEPEQNAIAWSRHPFETGDSTVAEVPAIPGTPATPATYDTTWISENGSIWKIPLGDVAMESTLDASGVARNIGGGKVGLPYADHPWAAGQVIRVAGTTNYNGAYTLGAGTTEDELEITHAYVAETFTGSETVVCVVTIPSGSGYCVVDEDDNVYCGHNYSGGTFVTKVTPENVSTTNFIDVASWGAAATGTSLIQGLAIHGTSLYVWLKTSGATYTGWMYKWDLTTGTLLWLKVPPPPTYAWPTFGIDVDDDGNAYAVVASGLTMVRFASADGSMTYVPLPKLHAGAIGGANYGVDVDDTSGKMILFGREYIATAYGASNIWNLCIQNHDGTEQVIIQVGGTYASGSITYTPILGTGMAFIRGDFIYAICAVDGTTPTLFKYDLTGTLITSTATASYGNGIFFDFYGNLVVVNNADSSPQTDVFWFYDENLTYLGKLNNFYSTMLASWGAAAGGTWIQGGIVFHGDPEIPGSPGTPAIPAYEVEGSGVNSVAVIPSDNEDEVWITVTRVIDGVEAKYLEQMQARSFGDEQKDAWFVDSGLSLDTSDADGIVSGLDHLEGQEVVILVDGAVRSRQTVTDGSIDTGNAILAKAIVGLPFRYTLKPMRFDLDIQATTKGSLKRFAELVISFYRSLNVEYGTDTSHLFHIDWRTEEAFGSPPALYTGDKVVVHEGGFDVEDCIIITGDDPLPCTVRAMIPRIELTGR